MAPCLYLLLVANYNNLDADMYTLPKVTVFLLHISTLILVIYLYYLYSIFSTSYNESPVIASPLNMCLEFEVFSSWSKELMGRVSSLSRHINCTSRLYH